ncbi:hypothetical protein AN2929.2 [Paecilomyces variotii No. 5]|uniref:PWI domain-containing protein n=1 Tax=Byssochlamys spectabilis (strain No. 5 / NBRC 109023) TaxID=1356009 RepID=V5GBP8_BYSSN|nr:hypothetical protein AN2929.2 [Paecilomyces variotii No. 5]
MQVAEILSDLTSLRACNHNEAIALVTVHRDGENAESAKAEENQSPDLQRAKDLIDLHYNVKMKHMTGQQPGTVDEGLRKAREDPATPLFNSTRLCIPHLVLLSSPPDRSILQAGDLQTPVCTMAASVDAKLLRQTKFPPEFSKKVDMTKVNIEVMKKWIAGKIIEILGNEDDVVIELCFNLLEGSRFPDIKSLQIQLTGFLDKDTPKFCKDLWNLCLSAQENPQGVPKELLEAKKLELRQGKLDAEKAAEEARRRKEQEQNREREIDNVRQRERANRGGRGPPPGGRGVAVRPDTESPARGGNSIHMFRRLHDEDVAPPGRSRGHCLALRLHRDPRRRVDHAMREETDPETGDEDVRSVALVPQTGGIPGGRADVVLMPVIELDP